MHLKVNGMNYINFKKELLWKFLKIFMFILNLGKEKFSMWNFHLNSSSVRSSGMTLENFFGIIPWNLTRISFNLNKI